MLEFQELCANVESTSAQKETEMRYTLPAIVV